MIRCGNLRICFHCMVEIISGCFKTVCTLVPTASKRIIPSDLNTVFLFKQITFSAILKQIVSSEIFVDFPNDKALANEKRTMGTLTLKIILSLSQSFLRVPPVSASPFQKIRKSD